MVTTLGQAYRSFIINNGKASINGRDIACYSMFTTFEVNGLPYMHAILGPGTSDSGLPGSYYEIYSILQEADYGSEVSIEFNMTGKTKSNSSGLNENVVLWDSGHLEGWGPVSANGVLLLHIWASHWMAPLNWVSILSDQIHGRNASDERITCKSDAKNGIVPYLQGENTSASLLTNMWESFLKPELLMALGTSFFQASETHLDTAKTALNKGILEADMAFMVGNADEILLDMKKSIYVSENDTTLWDKLIRLATRFQFSIVPRITDFCVVPFMRTLGGDQSSLLLDSSFLYKLQDTSMQLKNFTTRAYGIEAGDSFLATFDSMARISTQSSMAGDSSGYKPYIIRTPPWTGFSSGSMKKTAETIGLRDIRLLASGYAISDEQQSGNTLSNAYNLNEGAAIEFLQAQLASKLYYERTAILKMPFILDYAPGSQVIFEPTLSRESEGLSATTKLIGVVQKVCLGIDHISRKGGTWLLLTNIHTEKEQENIQWTEHPIYKKRWLRTPLTTLYQGFAAETEHN